MNERPDLGEITVFKKSGGRLSKRITLRDGKIVNDSSDCFMAHGSAHRAPIDTVQALADLINKFASNQAYALGRLKDGVLDDAKVVTAAELKDAGDPAVVARTKDYLIFKEGAPGFVLLDIDVKDMPETVKRQIEECGGPLDALCQAVPALKTVARVERASTSSGLRNTETGETYPGSGGMHIVIRVSDAADIPRFLSDLFNRLWLADFGFGLVSADGRFLERSLVDKCCGSPERLIFEAAPILEPPLVQEGREAIAYDGTALDTRTACLPVTTAELRKLKKLKAAERARLLPERQAKREAWSRPYIEQLTAGGMAEAEARAQVDRWLDWQELSGDFPLPFDDPRIVGTTVAAVLAAPDNYVDKTLSDPFEGPGYGRGKAKLLRRADGSLSIHSFAHGGANYELKADRSTGVVLPRSFKLSNDGLWFRRQDEDEPPVKVCGPFTIEAWTSDDSDHNHGLLLKWAGRNGGQHGWSMPLRLVHAEGNAIAAELADAGLSCGTSRPAHELLKRFLNEVVVQRHVRCVDRAGWHGTLYVLPNGRVFGADTDSIVLQTGRAALAGAYAERGTLCEWRDHVVRYAVGNDLLVLAISTAFAAPLLDVLGAPSGGVHLHGISQSGKTTMVRCAKSVYGPADDKHMRTWRATANGLEAVAAENSDGLLVLDEIVQAIARELEQVVYMLANNAGKARASRAGGARQQINWRLLFLSTGEMTAEAKLAEAGLRVHAGQDVRLIGLSADAGAGMGVFQNLHDFPSAAAFAEHLRATASTYCGTAGPAYLNQLARERAGDPEQLTATLRALCQRFWGEHVPSGADGQVGSVARRFALIAAAGELATAYDITGWPDDEALRAAATCFKRWLSARGGAGAAEDMQAVAAVRVFITQHGNSRFEKLRAVAESDEEMPDDRIVINRAGWKRQKDGEWEYLIPPDTWTREVCAGLDPSRVAAALAKGGFLLGATERHNADSIRITGYPRRMRLYRVSTAILGEETDGK